MKKILTLIISLQLTINLYSQNDFIKSFDSYTHSIYGICKINSLTYALTGTANDTAGGNWDFILIKGDLNGNIIFSKKYNNPLFSDESFDLISVSDGGFLLSVRSDSIDASGFKPYPIIVKLDSSGNSMWSKKIQTTKNSELHTILECQNGDFVLGGTQDGIFGTEAMVIRTDNLGDSLWSRKLGSPGFGSETFNDVIETNNNNLLFIGNTPLGVGGGDILVSKYNIFGDTVWAKTYGTSGQDYGRSLIKSSNGSFYLCGFTYFTSIGKQGGFVIKIDSTGSILWSTILGTNYNFSPFKIIELPNNDLLLSGTVKTSGGGTADGINVIIDSLGILKSTFSYGTNLHEELRESIIINDSTIISSGSIINSASSHSNSFLVMQKITNFQTCLDTTLILNDTLVVFQEGAGLFTYACPFINQSLTFLQENMPLVDSIICEENMLNIYELDETENKFSVYPNPFSFETNLYFYNEMQNASLRIFDLYGNEIHNINITGTHITIKKMSMTPGLYLLQISDQNNMIMTKKIVIQ